MTAGVVYPGTRPFERTDSGRFYGRTAEAAYLGEQWRRGKLTYLSGPAGIGKTSLLAAGVLPLVEAADIDLLPVGGLARGASFPVGAAGDPTPYTLAVLRTWSTPESVARLNRVTVDEFISWRAKLRAPGTPVLAAIDQADDLFAGPSSRQPQRQRFLRELADALALPELHLLICARDDALGPLTEALGPGTRFQLAALTPEQARDAVAAAGLVPRDSATELVSAVRTSRIVASDGSQRLVVADQVEPALLQAACVRLWDSLRAHAGPVTRRLLRRRFPDAVDAALSGYCGAAIAAVADVHGVPVDWLRTWLIGTCVTESGELAAAPPPPAVPGTAARDLEDRYLIRAVPGGTVPRRYRLISQRIVVPLRSQPEAGGAAAEEPDPWALLRAAERGLVAGELAVAERYAAKAKAAAADSDLLLHAQAESLLGNVACERGDLDAAVASYRAAAQLSEAARESAAVARLLLAIGQALAAQGRFDAAVAELRAAVNRMPSDATIQSEMSAAVHKLAWQLTAGRRPAVEPG